jgi:hypothetical protein
VSCFGQIWFGSETVLRSWHSVLFWTNLVRQRNCAKVLTVFPILVKWSKLRSSLLRWFTVALASVALLTGTPGAIFLSAHTVRLRGLGYSRDLSSG